MAENKNKPKVTEYFVNDEPRTTEDEKMTMAEIVEGAGFTPASDYKLKEEDHGNKTYEDPNDEVHVKKGQHFTVTYTGVTPTSQVQ
jgi:hypothetical protein